MGLELYYSVDGEPSQHNIVGDSMNMGEFDSDVGKDFEFYIHNNEHNRICDISNLSTEHPDTSFHGPSEILPLETVKCSIKIKQKEYEEHNVMTAKGLKSFTNMMTDMQEWGDGLHDRLEGNIIWKDISIIRENKETTYGWGN